MQAGMKRDRMVYAMGSEAMLMRRMRFDLGRDSAGGEEDIAFRRGRAALTVLDRGF